MKADNRSEVKINFFFSVFFHVPVSRACDIYFGGVLVCFVLSNGQKDDKFWGKQSIYSSVNALFLPFQMILKIVVPAEK